MSQLRTLFTAMTLLMVTSSLADAHPSHASTTEIEWNAKSKRFEVAMRLRIADVEDAISARIKSRFRLETDPDRKMHLQAYLQETFSITFEEHRQCRLHWVGCELELHDVWVFFEAESVAVADAAAVQEKPRSQKIRSWDGLFRESSRESKPHRIRIRNVTLLEIQPEQLNLVSVRMGAGMSRLATSFHQQKRDAELLESR